MVVNVGTAAFSRKTVLWKIKRQSHKTLPSAEVNLTIAPALLEATPPPPLPVPFVCSQR